MAMSTCRTTSVTVSYQSRAVIDAAIAPFRDACAAGQHACVVVDNDSRDGTADHVERAHPYARVIRAGGNVGFGRGCNLGAAHSDSEFVLFLNPDASLEPGELAKLVAFMDAHPRAAVCAPAIEDAAQRAGMMTRPRDVIAQAWGLPSYEESRLIVPGGAPFETTWVCGAVFLMRSERFRALGGFDPRFFLYFEETDLFLRCMQAGSEIWVVPAARARHRGGASARATDEPTVSGDIARHYFQSRFYYLHKHHGLGAAVAADVSELVPLVLRAALRRSAVRRLRERLRASVLRPPPRPAGAAALNSGAAAVRSGADRTSRAAPSAPRSAASAAGAASRVR
jgi:GT2 family glycosyltransferase